MANSILEPHINRLISLPENEQVSRQVIHDLAVKEATSQYLRLKDDQTLGHYNILQEHPHTFEWRQFQMNYIHKQI